MTSFETLEIIGVLRGGTFWVKIHFLLENFFHEALDYKNLPRDVASLGL